MQTAATPQHHNAGRAWGTPFVPGECGNPGGKTRYGPLVRAWVRVLKPEAVAVLRDVMHDPQSPAVVRTFAAAVFVEAAK
jgi:hypothetical protein